MNENKSHWSKSELEIRSDPLQLAVLLSNKGTGSNLQAIIDAITQEQLNAQIPLVLSDRQNAKGLQRAYDYDIPTQVFRLKDRESDEARYQYSRQVAHFLNREGISVAVMAGFMTVLDPVYFQEFEGITLNIHPGNIPDPRHVPFDAPDGTHGIPWNRGKMTEDAVKQFLVHRYACSSIHVATPDVDFGPVLRRVWEPVREDDDVESLYERLKKKEHTGLIDSLKDVQQFGVNPYRPPKVAS